ncbi:MAG: hypothetical protein QXO65_03560 [Candidatus Aenigmatarchaeota archaeon]
MFDIIQSVRAETAIKIKKNVALENIRGSKRRKEARGYKRLGYRKWAVYKKYGMKCVRTEIIFSPVKKIWKKYSFTIKGRSDCRKISEILGIRYNKMLC